MQLFYTICVLLVAAIGVNGDEVRTPDSNGYTRTTRENLVTRIRIGGLHGAKVAAFVSLLRHCVPTLAICFISGVHPRVAASSAAHWFNPHHVQTIETASQRRLREQAVQEVRSETRPTRARSRSRSRSLALTLVRSPGNPRARRTG